MEGAPKQEQASEDGYDGEAVRAEAEQKLKEMLGAVEVNENVPEKFRYAVSLRQLLNELDSSDTDNSLRHVVEAAAESLTESLGYMSHIEHLECQKYLAEVETAEA